MLVKRFIRRDGRKADALRPMCIEPGYLKFATGSVLVRSGDTVLVCSAMVEEKVPDFLNGRDSGWVTAEYAMLPASTPDRKERKPDGRSQEIRRLIGRALRGAVDLKKLGERTIWLDCDVLQADGGTRTLAVNGAWIALALAVRRLREKGLIKSDPVLRQVSAVSAGIVEGRCLLDLCYSEDSRAEVDMNVVMTDKGDLIEVQGTAEGEPFNEAQLHDLLTLARKGCREILRIQKAALRAAGARA
jgi:ribonuclease PH